MAESEVDASLGQLTLVTAPPPAMTTIDIATTDGDVLLTLGGTRLRVSSVILSSASPVFKAMLGPNFLEGQADRSAQNPKEIPLLGDDVAVMTRLCRLLHHQRDLPESSHDKKSLVMGAQELFDLTELADKYNCTVSIQLAGGYLLFELCTIPLSPDTPIDSLLHLAAAAYTLEDSRHFALFTRRLVLDFTVSYSLAASHYALASLPDNFLLLLEEQRNGTSTALRFGLPDLAEQRCYRHGCGRMGHDFAFSNALASKVQSVRYTSGPNMYWPPLNINISLRDILKTTFHCGNVDIKLATGCNHENDYNHVVYGDCLKALCNRVSKVARGLCLSCLQHGQFDASICPHHQSLEQWVANDPIS